MRILREYIRRMLTESTIDPKIMRMIDKAEKYGFFVDIMSNSVIIYDGHDTDKPRARVNFERDTSFGPCMGGAYVTLAKAEGGFGPLAYDVVRRYNFWNISRFPIRRFSEDVDLRTTP